MNTFAKRGPGRPPTEGLRERRQEEILDAAARLFAQQGFADADLQILADRLNVGKGTIYRYFPSKETLFLATVERSLKLMREYIAERVDHLPDPLDKIRHGIRSFFRFFAENPHFVELFLIERACFKGRRHSFGTDRETALKPWIEHYRAMMEQGRIRTMPILPMIDAVACLPYGVMFMNFVVGVDHNPEQQAELIADILLRGILTPEEESRQFPPGADGVPTPPTAPTADGASQATGAA